jgi:hypothetical protein
MGDQLDARPLLTKDSTTQEDQKDENKHPRLDRVSNP